jgi:hypothetical protein
VSDGLRVELARWLRAERRALLGPGAPSATVAQGLAALGLDDAGLGALAGAPRTTVTLPHASPNVFFPRAGVAWYARSLQAGDPERLHLRVVLTHVNFSDLGWRPYAWWHLDGDGALARASLFTRNKKRKHVVIAGQGPLEEVPATTVGADRAAAELACHAADRALSYMLIMATVERAAGLAVPGRTCYLPLTLLLRFFRERATVPDDRGGWLAALLAARSGARAIDASGELADVDDLDAATVFDNATNIALLSALGPEGVVGGAKMEAYWPDVEQRVAQARSRSGVAIAPATVARLPDGIDLAAVVPPSPALDAALDEAGIEHAQGLALSEHGAFAESLDPFGPAGRGGVDHPEPASSGDEFTPADGSLSS